MSNPNEPKVIPFVPRPQPQTLGAVRAPHGYGLILANGKPTMTAPSFADAITTILELSL
jgi:hypothetical protein